MSLQWIFIGEDSLPMYRSAGTFLHVNTFWKLQRRLKWNKPNFTPGLSWRVWGPAVLFSLPVWRRGELLNWNFPQKTPKPLSLFLSTRNITWQINKSRRLISHHQGQNLCSNCSETQKDPTPALPKIISWILFTYKPVPWSPGILSGMVGEIDKLF